MEIGPLGTVVEELVAETVLERLLVEIVEVEASLLVLPVLVLTGTEDVDGTVAVVGSTGADELVVSLAGVGEVPIGG